MSDNYSPDQDPIKLFTLAEDHPCSYLEDRRANSAFVDPSRPPTWEQYCTLSRLGFRRSGNHYYRPHCNNCNECKSCRIRAFEIDLSRKRFKRILNKAKNLTLSLEPATFSQEHYETYERYIKQRHFDGDMYPPTMEQYKGFLTTELPFSHLMTMRDESGHLILATCIDILDDGISAIYTYFDPDYEHLSPGTLAILKMCELAIKQGHPYVYLGYWVKDSPKMAYKRQFTPLDIFDGQNWLGFAPEN